MMFYFLFSSGITGCIKAFSTVSDPVREEKAIETTMMNRIRW